MDKIKLVRVYVGKYTRNVKDGETQKKINKYIEDEKLNVIAASLFKESEDDYLFKLTIK
ncbi:MAG: hypothetical protein K2K96_03770 [Lachnospiraceae bacterium]|nr:hypothetical protein [Lachnospiraceae bacterium]